MGGLVSWWESGQPKGRVNVSLLYSYLYLYSIHFLTLSTSKARRIKMFRVEREVDCI